MSSLALADNTKTDLTRLTEPAPLQFTAPSSTGRAALLGIAEISASGKITRMDVDTGGAKLSAQRIR